MATVSTTTFTSDTEQVTRTKLNDLVANLLAEFNGNIDNDNIDASAAIAISKLATTGAFSCTSIDIGSTIAITGVLDEDNMASDSAVKLCTQQSIKKYVDDNSGGSGDLLANGTVPLTADWNAGDGSYDITAVEFKGALKGQADTVATITGLAPDTATTQATQANITTCVNLTTVGAIATGSWEATDVAIAHGGTGASTAADAFAALKQAASTTATGVVEIATAAEINTGTDTGRAVSPDSLAGSSIGTRIVSIKIFPDDTAVTTGDGKFHWFVPSEMTGMDLVGVSASVSTVSSSGLPTVQIHNLTDTSDMLSTEITIDENEKHSKDAATAAVINTGEDDVVTGDEIRIDVDTAGTGTKGLTVDLKFRIP